MGCGTSKNALGSPAEAVLGTKAPASQPSTAAASAAKVADKLKEPAEDTNAEPLVIVQTPAINGACEETGQPASVSAKPGEQPESQHPANQQHPSDSGRVGDAVASSTAPTTTARVTESGPSPVESAPAGETPERAQSREAAAEASSYADRSSPAERPSVSRPGALPPILTRRPSQPNGDEAGAPAEAPADASKLRSRFKSVAAEEDAPPSPQMFASSRSLNRSIGVRRRTSDAEGSTAGSEHAARCEAEEERELAGPDPLREQFERDKDNNPLLRRPTAMSARNSEKSMKSAKSKGSKRPSVGFALGEEDDDDDVDPIAHLEAERIASITMPHEEPARAVRMAAAGLGVGPGPAQQRRSSGGGGRGGLRLGSR